jgi:MFS family permease
LSLAQEIVRTGTQRIKPAAGLLSRRYFLLSLLLGTWLPNAFFILMAPAEGAIGGLAGVKMIFLFLGTAHVPATLFFYTDRQFFGIIKDHRLRYIYVPLLLTLVTGILFALLSFVGQAFLLLTFWAWQAFHYGRQNIGVYAFASIAQTGAAPHRAEKLAIDCGTLLGILGTFKILGTAVAPDYLHGTFDRLYQFGSVAFAAVFIFSLVVYLKFYRDTTVFKTLFFFTSVFFFYPVFVSTNMNIAFLSYAMAHGLQYIIFMTIVSANTNDGHQQRMVQYRNLLTLAIFVFVVGFLFWRVGDLRQMEVIKSSRFYAWVADFLFGAVLGATMSHFVVDASAWKLSMARQRTYISKRFGFIFEKGDSRKVNE